GLFSSLSSSVRLKSSLLSTPGSSGRPTSGSDSSKGDEVGRAGPPVLAGGGDLGALPLVFDDGGLDAGLALAASPSGSISSGTWPSLRRPEGGAPSRRMSLSEGDLAAGCSPTEGASGSVPGSILTSLSLASSSGMMRAPLSVPLRGPERGPPEA